MSPFLIATVLICFAWAANAQMPCGEYEAITRALKQTHHETSQGFGIDNAGNVTQLFASPTGTWTLLVIQPAGRTCLVASGKHWEPGPIQTAKVGECRT